jgi:hypothetical protein
MNDLGMCWWPTDKPISEHPNSCKAHDYGPVKSVRQAKNSAGAHCIDVAIP